MNTPSSRFHSISRPSTPTYFLSGANIVIASTGPEPVDAFRTRFGELRSRSGALLRYTKNDAKGIYNLRRQRDPDSPDDLHVLLIDPTIGDVESAIASISSRLHDEYGNAIGLDLFFAGHGAPCTGGLILKDGVLLPDRFLDLQAKDVGSGSNVRRIGVFLDSCYSGAFLLNLAIHAFEDFEGFRFDGSLASCLPDEESYELDILDHGVFTYTHLYEGNRHVDSKRFNQAILENDVAEIAKGLQGLVSMNGSSATAFLTEGRQFPIFLAKHTIDVEGGFARVNLADQYDFGEISEQLTKFRREALLNQPR